MMVAVFPTITWELPIKTISECNVKQHWAKASKRHKLQQRYIRFAFLEYRPKITLPCIITLVRVGKRRLDDDNLRVAFKWIKDQIAQCLIPNTKLGQADDDPRLIWHYDQSIGEAGVRISFAPLSQSPS